MVIIKTKINFTFQLFQINKETFHGNKIFYVYNFSMYLIFKDTHIFWFVDTTMCHFMPPMTASTTLYNLSKFQFCMYKNIGIFVNLGIGGWSHIYI